MNYPKYLVNSFAILGVISLIFFACASTDIDSGVPDDTNPPVVATGKYQISSYNSSINSSTRYMDIVDTETGVVKHYQYIANYDKFVLLYTTITQ